MPHVFLPQTDPLEVILNERQQIREICNGLEAIADSLLDGVNATFCQMVLRRLTDDLPVYLKDEEALIDALRSNSDTLVDVRECRKLVKGSHEWQEAYVHELTDPLIELIEKGRVQKADMVGYALRCCFDSIRHHMDWEDLFIFHNRLNSKSIDTPALRSNLARNRQNAALPQQFA